MVHKETKLVYYIGLLLFLFLYERIVDRIMKSNQTNQSNRTNQKIFIGVICVVIFLSFIFLDLGEFLLFFILMMMKIEYSNYRLYDDKITEGFSEYFEFMK